MGGNNDPHTKRWCALIEPYPEPKVLQPNFYYATLLLEDYAGSVSEMTAINQYIYHHITFEDNEELAELEECISIIEMHHLELLGESIKLLGIPPEFRTLTWNQPAFWNAGYVYYGQGICDRLAADIAAEKQAVQNYRYHQYLIDDIHIKNLLERIIKDEEYHLKLFTDAYMKYCPGRIN